MRPQFKKPIPFSLQAMFTPDPSVFVKMPKDKIEEIMWPYRFLAQIIGQVLREHYGFKDVKAEMLAINKRRMLICLSEDENNSATPTKFNNATGQKIQRFVDDLMKTKEATDIYVSPNNAGQPVISFEAHDMIEALKHMTAPYNNADRYQEALDIAAHLGRNVTICTKGLKLV